MQAEALLVRGRADRVIPYQHSLALGRALPPERTEVFIMKTWPMSICARHARTWA